MPEGLKAILGAHRCHIKAAWVQRLRAQPPKTALGHADILIYRMDETLHQLLDFLDQLTGVRRPATGLSLRQSLSACCHCGLSPLLDFFVAGDFALREVLYELSPKQQAALEQAWHTLAQLELETLCSACCRLTAGKTPCPRARSHLGAACTRLR
jgi:hypothetical protein